MIFTMNNTGLEINKCLPQLQLTGLNYVQQLRECVLQPHDTMTLACNISTAVNQDTITWQALQASETGFNTDWRQYEATASLIN